MQTRVCLSFFGHHNLLKWSKMNISWGFHPPFSDIPWHTQVQLTVEPLLPSDTQTSKERPTNPRFPSPVTFLTNENSMLMIIANRDARTSIMTTMNKHHKHHHHHRHHHRFFRIFGSLVQTVSPIGPTWKGVWKSGSPLKGDTHEWPVDLGWFRMIYSTFRDSTWFNGNFHGLPSGYVKIAIE